MSFPGLGGDSSGPSESGSYDGGSDSDSGYGSDSASGSGHESDSGYGPGGSDSGHGPGGYSDHDDVRGIIDRARVNRDDFLFGDDRAIGDPPNWASQDSKQLYDGAVMQNSPSSADEQGQSWMHNGKELTDAADLLYEAIRDLGGVWRGEASGAAKGALIGVANSSSTAGDAASTMGKRMKEQSAAAAEIKKMPPPKDFDMDNAVTAAMTGGPAAMTADIKKQKDASDAVKAEQQRFMQEYTGRMTEIDGSTPDFGPESIGMRPLVGGYGAGDGIGGLAGLALGGANSGGVGNGGSGNVGNVDLTLGDGKNAGGHAGGRVDGLPTGDGEQGHQVQLTNELAPSAMSGTAPTTEAPGASGIGAGLGVAAAGLGAGLVGARALAKGRGGVHKSAQNTEQAAAAAAEQHAATAEAAAAERVQSLGDVPPAGSEPQQGPVEAGQPQQTPHQGPPQQHAPQGPPPQQFTPAQQPPPQAPPPGQPGAEFGPQQPHGPAPQPPQAPAPQPHVVQSAPTAPAGPVADGSVSASADQSVQQGPQQAGPSHPMAQQQGPLANPAAQAAQAGMPMAPMHGAGGMGAGMAGAGMDGGGAAGASGGSNTNNDSYMIAPDPDSLFGPDEAVMSDGVIGAFEDDELEDD